MSMNMIASLLLAASGPMYVETPKTDANRAVIEQFHRYNQHCKDVLILMTYSGGDFKPLIKDIATARGYSDQERINLQNHCMIYSAGVSMNFKEP